MHSAQNPRRRRVSGPLQGPSALAIDSFLQLGLIAWLLVLSLLSERPPALESLTAVQPADADDAQDAEQIAGVLFIDGDTVRLDDLPSRDLADLEAVIEPLATVDGAVVVVACGFSVERLWRVKARAEATLGRPVHFAPTEEGACP